MVLKAVFAILILLVALMAWLKSGRTPPPLAAPVPTAAAASVMPAASPASAATAPAPEAAVSAEAAGEAASAAVFESQAAPGAGPSDAPALPAGFVGQRASDPERSVSAPPIREPLAPPTPPKPPGPAGGQDAGTAGAPGPT
jgi:hypothetical protein